MPPRSPLHLMPHSAASVSFSGHNVPAPKPVMAPYCCQGPLPDTQEPPQPTLAPTNLFLAVASYLVSGADFFLASLPLPTVPIPPTCSLRSGWLLPLCSITQCLRPSRLPPLCPQGCPWVQPRSELTLIRPCRGMLTAALAPGSRPLCCYSLPFSR